LGFLDSLQYKRLVAFNKLFIGLKFVIFMQTIIVFSRIDFRRWLRKNHEKERRVAIILHKKHTGKPVPTHRELMEEAICFGWIDTIVKRLDENKYFRNFTKRNENSRWSENTLSYAKKLIKDKKMAPMGLKFYKLGLKKPVHGYGVPKNPDIPIELKRILSKDKKTKEKFNKLPPSKKKMIYRWIISAKLPKTKKRRIEKVIRLLNEGKKDFF